MSRHESPARTGPSTVTVSARAALTTLVSQLLDAHGHGDAFSQSALSNGER